MKLDILAIGAHPDDVELACSGILILHKQLGYKTGVIDLTRGELGTRGTAETRDIESAKAAEILGLDMRMNLRFRDGFFQNDETHQLALMKMIRKYQPNIVLINAPHDRHPDHGKGAALAKDTCFLAGLSKIETELDGENQKAWRPKRVFHYIQDIHIEPHIIIDVTPVFEQRMESIRAYASQFYNENYDGPKTYISSNNFMNYIESRCRDFGKRIGTEYGEGLVTTAGFGLKSFDDMVLPEFS
ncbi:MAG: bacillithiol biosynthesis deacetylase BshB1 [Chitinophagaceae bacterium]|nr:bacillithiol biosynthesis deacetylase BshB1 [Chitinophagaceae bacterium]